MNINALASNVWILFLALPLIILFPVLLIVILPASAIISYFLMRKPKQREMTLDEWWDANWRSYL